MQHIANLKALYAKDITGILDLSSAIKADPKAYENALHRKSLAMLFQKTSTRTRLSFEVAMTQLGGHGVFIDWQTSNFVLSSIRNESGYVSRNADCIMARLMHHSDLLEIIEGSRVPVINGCCEKFHPCQALTDVLTMREHAGGDVQGKTLCYVGVQNNVSNSLTLICSKLGINLVLATPEVNDNGESRDADVDEIIRTSATVSHTTDPHEGVAAADFVYTDTWIDMQYFNNPKYKDQKEATLARMMPYQLNEAMIGDREVRIMHDMPIHEGYEISSGLVHDPRSVIFDQAENRLHAQKGLLVWLLGESS
ncbi:MAG: ornithine carbamoyltransferase [Gammaproteobacteria bacterium]|nr:ornithine carbamoyltransferase [Gammaproteobacteria bacterium]